MEFNAECYRIPHERLLQSCKINAIFDNKFVLNHKFQKKIIFEKEKSIYDNFIGPYNWTNLNN